MTKIDIIEIKALTPNRYFVKLKKDGIEEKITLISETLIEHGIFKPRAISKDEYQSLKDATVIDELKSKAIHYVSFQPRLSSEVISFLKKKEASKKQIDQIITNFNEANLLDDEGYVKSFIDDAIKYEYDGPFKIREKLLKKGADSFLIERYLCLYNDEVQKEKLSYLLEKELKYTLKKPLGKMVQTFKSRFVSKGFSMVNIDHVLSHYKEDIKAKIDEEFLLNQELKKIPKKMFDKNHTQKLIGKLMRMGFSYSLIKEKVKGGSFDETNE